MTRRTPLRRYTRIRPRRETPRKRKTVVRLTGRDLEQLRHQCWGRDHLRCVDCGLETYWKARWPGDPLAYDMAHVQSRGAGGSDTLDNVVTKCHRCHMAEHAGRKPQTRGEI